MDETEREFVGVLALVLPVRGWGFGFGCVQMVIPGFGCVVYLRVVVEIELML